ncbi:MAG: hypothetical protein WC968_01270 [Bacilli bacterium]
MKKESKMIETKKRKGLFSKITGGILFGLVFLLLGFQVVGTITARQNNGIARYGSFQSFRVETDSMVPAYKVDTMIFVKDVDPAILKASTTPEAKDGDTITFIRNHGYNYTATGDQKIITHRIIEITFEEGEYYFRTLGDNLEAMTCPPGGCSIANADWVRESDLIGVVVGQSMALGYFSRLLSQPIFMLLFIMIPLLFIFASSLVDLFKELKTTEKAGANGGKMSVEEADFAAIKEQEKLKMMIEIEKERLRKEIEEGVKDDEK